MLFKIYLVIPEVISTDPEVENKLMIHLEIEKRKTNNTHKISIGSDLGKNIS